MFIRTVDDSLERLVRSRLQLNEDVGDVTFDVPTGAWSAQLSRIAVNFYLYNVQPSGQPSRTVNRRVDANGAAERRNPQPMIQLDYLVSAWAGSPRDEHQLLGELINLFAATQVLGPDQLTGELSSNVGLSMAPDESTRPREVWAGSGGQLKAAFHLQATVAADSFGWEGEAPLVQRIEAMARRMPATP